MDNIPLLKDIVIVMAITLPIIIVLSKAGIPAIVGYLVTGVIIGPYGFRLVTEMNTVETLSQIGVVLLLFTIGLEFSITRMLDIRREGMLGGGLQVGATVLAVLGVALALNQSFSVALLLGFIISLSSSVIVLKLLMDRGEIHSAHGNLSLGILLFQDICVVLMVMVIQGLGGSSNAGGMNIAKNVSLALVAFVVIVVAVAYIIPRIFARIVKLRNREVFILTIVLVCLGTAWLTSLFGLSLALGAFIAGLAISESEYSNQIVAEVIPFRDTFSSLFFVSIGMLLDVQFFIANIGWLVILLAATIAVKAVVIIGVGQVLRYPLRLSMIVGLNLAQIGEFSFILINMGHEYALLSVGLYQSLLAVSIMSMAATPFMHKWSSRAAMDAMRVFTKGAGRDPHKKIALQNHVIIVGYGLNGRNLARVLKETAIAHLIIDVNVDRVHEAKAAGHKAYFGDPAHPEILRKMAIDKASMIVVAISDPITARRIVKSSRDLNPTVFVLVRTRSIREVEELYKLGANQVIPEEFETSVEIFARVLKEYRIPGNIIQNQIDLVRQEGYAMLRNPSITGEKLQSLAAVLEKSLTDTFFVDEANPLAGKTLEKLGIRKQTGATVIAVVRNGEAKTNPPEQFTIEAGDILVVLGSHAELHAAFEMLRAAA
ncbi:MAG: cation:proton antiporter [Deltaproteobacteria bacterium]|nr:cation:proton antiporter [Deltaproteobacteria bacterium]